MRAMHNMSVLYPNLCYNKVCYKGAALAVLLQEKRVQINECTICMTLPSESDLRFLFAFFCKSFMDNSLLD